MPVLVKKRAPFRYPAIEVGREYRGLVVVGLVTVARPRKWWCRCLRCGHERAVMQQTITGSGKNRCPNAACRRGFETVWSRAEQEAHPLELSSWRSMIWRCHSAPSLKCLYGGKPFPHPQYVIYRGRGIVVCERWRVFANFLADMGPRPAGRSIDRINTHGNYEPGNCRWATATEQSQNRRNTRRYRLIHGGVAV